MKTDSKSVLANFAPEENGANRGLAMMICPVCGERVQESDLERYYEEKTENRVELCTDCREEFEGDNDLSIESDTLDGNVYDRLLAFAVADVKEIDEEIQGLTEVTAPTVATALGGDAWQSGGGIWVIVKRTTDGRVVTITPEVVNEYADEAAFEEDRPQSSLVLE